MLASDADFISGKIEEIKAMTEIGGIISGGNRAKVLMFIRKKEPELYEWAKKWFRDNKINAKKLFEAIKEYIGKKEFVFNTKGLTLAKLQKLDFKGPALDIPEKEEELVKQTIEKVKDRLEGQYGGKSKELKSNTIQDVISVINKDSNSNMFSWSTQQSPSGIASTLDYLYSEVSPEDTEVFQTTDTEIIPRDEQLKTQWTSFFDEERNIDFYKKVNSLYKNVDEKTRGRFDNTEAWLETASRLALQENKKFGNPDELNKDFIVPIGNFITKIKKKDLGEMKPKQINLMFAQMQDYMQKFEMAWKFSKGDEKLPVSAIDAESEPQGLEALAAKLKPYVEKIVSQPKNQGKSSDELYDELEQIFKNQPEAEDLSDKQVDQVVKKAVDGAQGTELLDDIKKQYGDKIKKEELTKEEAEEVVEQLNNLLQNNKLVFQFGPVIKNIPEFGIHSYKDKHEPNIQRKEGSYGLDNYIDKVKIATEDDILLTGYNTTEEEREVAIKFLKAISKLITESREKVIKMIPDANRSQVKRALDKTEITPDEYRLLGFWLTKNKKNKKLKELFGTGEETKKKKDVEEELTKTLTPLVEKILREKNG
jgi:S-adenosylmethionine hydrolase